jgi:hypothetical protein
VTLLLIINGNSILRLSDYTVVYLKWSYSARQVADALAGLPAKAMLFGGSESRLAK